MITAWYLLFKKAAVWPGVRKIFPGYHEFRFAPFPRWLRLLSAVSVLCPPPGTPNAPVGTSAPADALLCTGHTLRSRSWVSLLLFSSDLSERNIYKGVKENQQSQGARRHAKDLGSSLRCLPCQVRGGLFAEGAALRHGDSHFSWEFFMAFGKLFIVRFSPCRLQHPYYGHTGLLREVVEAMREKSFLLKS